MSRDRSSAVEVAAALLGDLARRDESLAPATTYRVGGAAALVARPRSDDDLLRIADAVRASGIDVLVVGRGSNLLVADDGFDGLAVLTGGLPGEIEIAPTGDGDGVIVTAGGGVSLPVLARRTAAAGVTGFEWAVGVPGSVGGAVRMNAGGHGSDMTACLVDVDMVDLRPGGAVDLRPGGAVGLERVAAGDLGLRFRSSVLTDGQVVVRARLALRRGDRAVAERTIADIVRWRREHQPGGQNCGSVFVNPVPGELSAGALIDGLGLRGLTIGGARVSEKHANFVQADDGACADDVRAVIDHVRSVVADATGIRLRSEVRLVGFAPGTTTRPERCTAPTGGP